jgi:hypothetical protein
MRHSVELTTPIPSAEKIAERLGLSKQRRKMLFDLADGSHVEKTIRSSSRKTVRKVSSKGAQTSR